MCDNPSLSIQKSTKAGAFKLLTQYIVRDKKILIWAIVWLSFATAADVAGPLLAKVLIDDYFAKGIFVLRDVLLILSAYLVTQVFAAVVRFQQTLRFATLALGAISDIRERVFAHVLRLPMRFHDQAITGQLVSRITNDTEAIKELYVQFLSSVVLNIIMLIGILVAMAILDVRLMIIAALLIPAVIGVMFLYERFSSAAVNENRQLRSDINAQLSESIQGVRVIQATAQEKVFQKKFTKTNNLQYLARLKTVKIAALLLRPVLDLVAVIILAGVLIVFGSQAVEATVEVGVLYAFVSYLSRFTEPLIEITQRFNLYQQAQVAGARVYALLEQPLETSIGTRSKITQGAVQFDAVSFRYTKDKNTEFEEGDHLNVPDEESSPTILKNINLTIESGEFIGVVGHTGSGKTTLLNLLLHFYESTKGHIRIDQHLLSEYSHDALHQGMGLIPQEPFVLVGSLRENICMNRVLDEDRIQYAVKAAQLNSVVERLPEGLETILGERGARLSTGERQLLSIARALVVQPKILLLDEATANIDSETEIAFQKALKLLRGNMTIIAVAHRLSTIRDADRIVVMQQGKLVEVGNHAELMLIKNGFYQRMYRLQQQQIELENIQEDKDVQRNESASFK
ncbi:MAG: ABC transporter transmembrane domain-containing protein [Pseudomonadota bacterium]